MAENIYDFLKFVLESTPRCFEIRVRYDSYGTISVVYWIRRRSNHEPTTVAVFNHNSVQFKNFVSKTVTKLVSQYAQRSGQAIETANF